MEARTIPGPGKETPSSASCHVAWRTPQPELAVDVQARVIVSPGRTGRGRGTLAPPRPFSVTWPGCHVSAPVLRTVTRTRALSPDISTGQAGRPTTSAERW